MNFSKKIISLFFLISILSFSKTVGLGGKIGTTTGLTFSIPKVESIYNVGLAYDLNDGDVLILTGDYLIKNKKIKALNDLPFWYGVQLKLDSHNKTSVSIQAKGELIYTLDNLKNVQFFTSISPGLKIVPETDVDIDISIGARYLFNMN